MKIKFKPAPRPLFSPFDGLDLDALRAAKADQKCKRGAKLNPKTGKCEPKHRRGSKV